MRIRECRPEDLSRLRAIQSGALAEPWPELLESAVQGPPTCHVVEDGTVVGYVLVLTDAESVAYVPELAVHPDEQGEGAGSELLAWLGARLARAGYRELRLTVRAEDTRARRFYERHGFELRERLPDHFDSGDGLLLARSLSPES